MTRPTKWALALVAALLLVACGSVSNDSLSEHVEVAMADLPYEYEILPTLANENYVVFKVFNPKGDVDLNIAFGLPAKDNDCPAAPRLPARHRQGSKPFSAAGPEPLICFEDDGWRGNDNRRESVVRINLAQRVASALCEQVYDGFTCFD